MLEKWEVINKRVSATESILFLGMVFSPKSLLVAVIFSHLDMIGMAVIR